MYIIIQRHLHKEEWMSMKKVAVVTGADRGLGLSISRWLLQNGYHVFAGRYLENCNFLEALKLEFSDRLFLIPLDVGNSENVKQAARIVASQVEHVDLIVNNAGINVAADRASILVDLDFEAMLQVYNVNSLGALRVNNALLGLLQQGTDKLIVNISSEAGSITENKRTVMYGYCMSKSAMNMQSSILHKHIRPMGGQVMVFHPGWLQSYISGKLNENAPIHPDESANKIMALVQKHKEYLGDQPAYLDLEGKEWPW
jgi:NAD(P)-dependent dehydrogenase (short-subunit alcohol dehydrogenase family)